MTAAVTELLGPGPAVGLAGLLDRPSGGIGDGWTLPDLWHWVYLLERPAQRSLGAEGHPVDGVPSPPGPGLRRMFAGGRVTTHTGLRLGEPATRTVEVVDTRARQGRSGPLTIITTRATIEQDGVTAVVDEQDIVYRAPSALAPAIPAPAEPGPPPDVVRDVVVDAALLFRFSALTYNAHRIHYDLGWCRAEDYADLVVHGPLQALLMAELAQQLVPLTGARFEYRLVAPLLLGQGLHVHARRHATAVVTTVCDDAGRITALGTRSPL